MTAQRSTRIDRRAMNEMAPLAYAIQVDWSNNFWMMFQENQLQGALNEFESCLIHADGSQVDLIHHGEIIRSACGLRR